MRHKLSRIYRRIGIHTAPPGTLFYYVDASLRRIGNMRLSPYISGHQWGRGAYGTANYYDIVRVRQHRPVGGLAQPQSAGVVQPFRRMGQKASESLALRRNVSPEVCGFSAHARHFPPQVWPGICIHPRLNSVEVSLERLDRDADTFGQALPQPFHTVHLGFDAASSAVTLAMQRRSMASSKSKSQTAADPGEALEPKNTLHSNGSAGSTIVSCAETTGNFPPAEARADFHATLERSGMAA